MKMYIYILVFGLTVSACTNSRQRGIIISVLEDITEADFVAKPNAKTLYSRFELDTDPWRFTTFRYGTISSLVHNKRTESYLEGGTALTGNQLLRDAEITKFQKEIDTVLTSSNYTSGYQFSSIWKPIVEELKYLQKDTISQTTLYVYSDLQENNGEWFSVHGYKDAMLLKTSPDSVKKMFLQRAQGVSSNTNIKVVVVHQPRTMKQDILFSQMRKLYTTVFRDLGIAIEFKANI